jgi:hypothetical protein
MTSIEGETTPGRGKRGDDVSWADANLTESKNEKKIHAVNSAAISGY